MAVALAEPETAPAPPPAGQLQAPVRFSPRVPPASWPAARRDSDEVLRTLAAPPFVSENTDRTRRALGTRLLLGWLGDQPGHDWQQRWLASGAEAARGAWRRVPTAWLHSHGHDVPWRQSALVEATCVAVCAEIVRPSLAWLVDGGFARGGLLVRHITATRDPEGVARLRVLCDGDAGMSVVARAACSTAAP